MTSQCSIYVALTPYIIYVGDKTALYTFVRVLSCMQAGGLTESCYKADFDIFDRSKLAHREQRQDSQDNIGRAPKKGRGCRPNTMILDPALIHRS